MSYKNWQSKKFSLVYVFNHLKTFQIYSKEFVVNIYQSLRAIFLCLMTTVIQADIPTDHEKRMSSYPYISGDTFRALCNHYIDETNHPFDSRSVRDGDIIFVRGYPEYLDAFLEYLPDITNKFILLTHNMDASMPGEYSFLLDDDRLIAWFTQNKDATNHSKLVALPIGIANRYWDHGNPEVLTNALKTVCATPKKHHLYVNFKEGTNLQERHPPLEYFKKQSFCYVATRKPWEDYLNDLACSRFVLSPPGNGLDCHRAWETLLMGSIPVMKSSSIDCLFEDLPVLIVQNWNEVTQICLEKKYQLIKSQNRRYKFDKLYADYWINLIKSYQERH